MKNGLPLVLMTDRPHTTRQILDILKENQAQAAFFCIGKNITGNEDLLKRMVREGHIIGNHSFSHHPLFDFFSSRKMLNDMTAMNQLVKNITGLIPRFFRPPYGVTNPNLKKAVMSGGFISIGWSIRSYDTVIKNEASPAEQNIVCIKAGSHPAFA